ncbi:hypothetical protein BDV19DRAFT_360977 [Aspergillus venezuelensis]
MILELHEIWGASLANVVRSIPGLAIHVTDCLTLIGWKGTISPAKLDEAFNMLETLPNTSEWDLPSEEALIDNDRFMAKYFLQDDDMGKHTPDREKTKEPLKLSYLNRSEGPVIAAAKKLGLQCAKAFHHIFIGWDGTAVAKAAQTIHDEQARQEAAEQAEIEAEEEARRAALFKPHNEYLRSRPSTSTSDPLTLNDLAGSYLVICDHIC